VLRPVFRETRVGTCPGVSKYFSKINFKNDVPNEKKNNKKRK
jgi:hypothetical protein